MRRESEANHIRTMDSANLDVLRAIAVLYVVVFHWLLVLNLPLQQRFGLHNLGHFGVLIFFVHTSLVLMYSLERMVIRYGSWRLYLAFTLRRLFRLLPLSMLVVSAIYVLRLPLAHFSNGHFEGAGFSLREYFANLFLLQDLAHVPSIEAPLWSLPYELQMYLVLPFLFHFEWRRRGAGLAFGIWCATTVVAFAASESVRIREALPFLPWGLLPYIPCFIAGTLAFQLRSARPVLPGAVWPLAIFAATANYLWHPNLRGWISCLLLAFVQPYFVEMQSKWIVVPARLIARYSYSIYLTHFICLWLAFTAYGAAPWRMLELFVVVQIVLALACFHLVEDPLMKTGKSLVKKLFDRGAVPKNFAASAAALPVNE